MAVVACAPAKAGAAPPVHNPSSKIFATHSLPLHKIAIFGNDDRRPTPKKFKRLRNSIGLLFNNQTSTACSAFCVDKNVIATASHCLFKINAKQRPKFSQFLFARRYDALQDYAPIEGGRSGAAQNIMAGSMHLSVRPPIDATGDWAFVRLAKPICKKSVLPIRSLPANDLMKAALNRNIFQLAYHRDYANWQLAYSKPCQIRRDYKSAKWQTIRSDFSHAEQLILHNCDTGGASSGSPILLNSPSGVSVVGINVGTYIQSNALVQNGKVTRRFKATTVANTAVSATAFANKLAIFRSAKILSSAEEIRRLQTELRRLSLYTDKIDGAYGRRTRNAIVAFERASGLPITGLASQNILRLISQTETLPARNTSSLSRRHRGKLDDNENLGRASRSQQLRNYH